MSLIYPLKELEGKAGRKLSLLFKRSEDRCETAPLHDEEIRRLTCEIFEGT